MPAIILSDNGALSGSAGLKTSGGNDGVLQLQTTTAGGTPTTAISISNTQVVTYTNQPTYTGGTANGVLYLNGSKAVTSGTALVFDGTNLGIGVAPSAWGSGYKVLDVNTYGALAAVSSWVGIAGNNYYNGTNWIYKTTGYSSLYQQAAGQHIWLNSPSGSAGGTITFTTAMTLDASGNLGLGVTPSAWFANSKAIQLGQGSFIEGRANNYTVTEVGSNVYLNSSGNWTYLSTAAAALYQQNAGAHNWQIVGSGTAGTTASFTQAMTLTASGRLGIGQTSPSETLHVSGSIRADNGSGTVTSLITTGGGSNFQVVHTSGDSVLSLLNSATAYGGFKLVGSTGSGMTLTGAEGILSAGNVPAYQTLGYFRFNLTKTEGTQIFCISSYPTVNEDSARFYSTNGSGASASATGMMVGKNSSTNRSINAAGTINASGADYAEYMLKCDDFVVAKGDVVGVDQDGKLTNMYADAISFVVKSTNPSYVGGDTWFTEKQPVDEEMKDVVDGPIYEEWVERREAARVLVDRIAFAGQVPVNVIGATPGQYIVPVDDNGSIKGVAVSNPTFEQYQQAVGKVIAIEQDGRARIIVKVA